MTDITANRAAPTTAPTLGRMVRALRGLLGQLLRDSAVTDNRLPGASRTRRDIGLGPDRVSPAQTRDRLMAGSPFR